jgi:CheY-like chemotaxis protein
MDEKHSVLCVDDEHNILKLLRRLLEGHGYGVSTATSGEEALQIMATKRIDLIISDQRMPVMTGSEFFRITREKYPNAIRIMMSGYSDFDSLVTAVNEGEIFRFISKPWDQKQFLELVRLALAQKDVALSIEEVIRNVCKVAKLVNKVSVEVPSDSQSLVVKIGEDEEVFSKDTVLRFLNILFVALGVEDKASSFAGAVTKEKGLVSISVDIGKGVMLRIQLPHMDR